MLLCTSFSKRAWSRPRALTTTAQLAASVSSSAAARTRYGVWLGRRGAAVDRGFRARGEIGLPGLTVNGGRPEPRWARNSRRAMPLP